MTDHATTRRAGRRLPRTAVFGAALAVSTLTAFPAAAVPETWEDTSNPSAAMALLTIGGASIAVIALITLLVYLPSMMRGASGESALTFNESSEWFGGPRTGVDAEAEEPAGTGGAGARW